MPQFLVPHKTGAHRIASIALFRALLSQCRALRFPADAPPHAKTAMQNLIRARFREQRHVSGRRQLNFSFAAGYEAVDCLDGAVAGDEGRLRYLVDLVRRAPEGAKRCAVAERRVERRREEEEENRKRGSLWERPLPLEKLSGGKRRVPILFSANQIPVLRFKKPQPENLTGYINHRIKLRVSRHERRMRLEEEAWLCKEEDRWDRYMDAEMQRGEEEEEEEEDTWVFETHRAWREVKGLLAGEKEKNRAMAERMQGVVDREREMAEREREEERGRRRERRIARRREKAEGGNGGGGGGGG